MQWIGWLTTNSYNMKYSIHWVLSVVWSQLEGNSVCFFYTAPYVRLLVSTVAVVTKRGVGNVYLCMCAYVCNSRISQSDELVQFTCTSTWRETVCQPTVHFLISMGGCVYVATLLVWTWTSSEKTPTVSFLHTAVHTYWVSSLVSYSNKVTCVFLTLNVTVPAIKVFVCLRVCMRSVCW